MHQRVGLAGMHREKIPALAVSLPFHLQGWHTDKPANVWVFVWFRGKPSKRFLKRAKLIRGDAMGRRSTQEAPLSVVQGFAALRQQGSGWADCQVRHQKCSIQEAKFSAGKWSLI
ncbi:UNVERIFIED_CONTAM: hypothetical protein K2H54_017711 [Gekko kuhli]